MCASITIKPILPRMTWLPAIAGRPGFAGVRKTRRAGWAAGGGKPRHILPWIGIPVGYRLDISEKKVTLQFWQELKDNGVVVVNDWNTAYYTNFSASSGKGAQPMVVSYASSPAAEVIYASTPLTEAPTASITAPGTCFRQVEFVGILKGTKQLALAQAFVDFMLDVDFQEDMPLQMFVYPVNPDASLPEEFTLYTQTAVSPAVLDMAAIDANREKWIQAWTEVMLK